MRCPDSARSQRLPRWRSRAIAGPALAQDAAAAARRGSRPHRRAPTIDTGDTAWMLTSTALVLMMTIPGLALFYGGMVRKKNVLATLAQSFGATCIITVLWMIIGYSIAFTTNDSAALNSYIGGFNYFLLGADDPQRDQLARADHSRVGLHVLPDDLRDHHAGADRRRARRPHEVLGLPVVHGRSG